MDRFELETTIAAPAGTVFAYVTEFPHGPEWQRGVARCEWTSVPPLAVGSTYDQVSSFMGKDIICSFEVVALDPGRWVRVESRGGPFPMRVERGVEAVDDEHCRFREAIEGDSGGFYQIGAPLLRTQVRRWLAGDHRRLREHFAATD